MRTTHKLLILPMALGFFGLLAWGLVVEAGPDRGRSAVERQEAKDKAGKKRVEEEDEPGPAKSKDGGKKRVEEEEDPKPIKPGVDRLDADTEKQSVPAGDLAAAARDAKH